MRLARSFHVSLRKVDEVLAPHRPFPRMPTEDETGTLVIPPAVKRHADAAYATFWSATKHIWRGIAANLYSRWVPPAGVTVADVEQELWLAVWRLLLAGTYNADKGRTLADYIVYNACQKAKYWLHKQRQANLHGNHDKNPSRFARSFTELGIDLSASANHGMSGGSRDTPKASTRIAKRMSVGPTQEGAVVRREKLEQLLATCTTMRERFALAALFFNDGSQLLAARAIYSVPIVRQICRFGSETQALAAVRRVARDSIGLEAPDEPEPENVNRAYDFDALIEAEPEPVDRFDLDSLFKEG